MGYVLYVSECLSVQVCTADRDDLKLGAVVDTVSQGFRGAWVGVRVRESVSIYIPRQCTYTL